MSAQIRLRVARWFMLAVALSTAPLTGIAQQVLNRGWALDADGAIKVFNDVGSIRVIGWDRDSVAVSGTVAASSNFFSGGTRAGVKLGIESLSGKSMPTDLVMRVPARARLWVRSAVANIDVSAFAGALDVSTVGGTVHVQGTPTEVRAESMNGALDISASPAYMRLKSATGAISWTGSSEDVGVITVSGRVVINAGTVQRARFESIDGDIRFSGSVSAKSALAIDTHSGNVTLAITKGTVAQLEVFARGCELFGVKEGQSSGATATAVPKQFYRAIGKTTMIAPSIVVRTYKGYVSAVMQ